MSNQRDKLDKLGNYIWEISNLLAWFLKQKYNSLINKWVQMYRKPPRIHTTGKINYIPTSYKQWKRGHKFHELIAC